MKFRRGGGDTKSGQRLLEGYLVQRLYNAKIERRKGGEMPAGNGTRFWIIQKGRKRIFQIVGIIKAGGSYDKQV